MVGTAAAAFGGSTIAAELSPVLATVSWIGERADTVAFAIVVAVISFLSLVLGELVPKSLALRSGEAYALLMAKPLLALSWLARPAVWLLTATSNLVLRPFSDRTDFMETRVSTEELQQMVEEAAETGALHEHASEIASRALEFDKLTLAEVIVPRNRIDALDIDATSEDIRKFLLERRRSRIPVYEGDLDNVVGYVSVKDVLGVMSRGNTIVLRELLRAVKAFPETVPAIEVLLYMRDDNQRIAIAVDEHGLLSGLVTFEDLVDELVGEVFEQEGMQPALVELGDGSVSVRGDFPIRDINREMDLELEESDGVTTIGGLCNKLASGMPNRGARLAAGHGVTLVVQDATPRAVRRVRIIPPEAEEETAEEETDNT